MRRTASALSALLALVFATEAHASTQEVQAWKSIATHIHTAADVPMLQTLAAPITVPITTLLHNQCGTTLDYVRWSDGSNVKQIVPLSVAGDCSSEQVITTNITLDPAKFDASGWRELRITSNIDVPEREFTTTRYPVNVVNGKPRSDYAWDGVGAGRCGGGGWYPDTDYRVVFVDCRDVRKSLSGVWHPGEQVRVKFQDGVGAATWDPHFHAGDFGFVQPIPGNAPNTWLTITIPQFSLLPLGSKAFAPGWHKLHLRALGTTDNLGEAGAYVLSLYVAAR
jgi:hypothetical protein